MYIVVTVIFCQLFLVWKKREPANRIGEASIKILRIRINFYDFLGFAKDAWKKNTLPETNIAPKNVGVGRLLSYWGWPIIRG